VINSILLSACALFAALYASGLPAAESAKRLFPDTPGLCSYTFRNQFAKDVPGTLDAVKALGITDLEFSNLFGLTAGELRKLLDERGLVCSSFGVGYDAAVNKTDEVARDALALGATYVRVASIPHKPPFTAERAREAAVLAGKQCQMISRKHTRVPARSCGPSPGAAWPKPHDQRHPAAHSEGRKNSGNHRPDAHSRPAAIPAALSPRGP
jgi:hypothetical protein